MLAVEENEGLYLPGGGRESGETAEQNVTRELAEELCRAPASLQPLPDAVEFFYSHVDRCHYELRPAFFLVTLADVRLPGTPLVSRWARPDELARASHVWAAGLALGLP